ncbi:MAG: ParM/StbA family protein [Chloroflexota bacterium]|nr:ParM/StbA family protein [Chloroflexota bacterium]
MKTYAYGHDFGNAEICAVLMKAGQPLMKSIPTAFAKIDTARLQNLGIETSDAIVLQFQDEAAQWGIGPVALAQASAPWDGRGDLMRYASKHSLRALLALSASMVPDKEYGLYVTCGLPAETFQRNPNIKKEIKKAISGSHTFTLDGGKTWRTCHIEYGTCLMEGAGALMAYAKRDNTSPQGAAVIDIGGRTTDLYVVRAGVPVAEFCQGRPLGVVTAAQMLQSAFERQYDFPLNPLETRAILFAYANSEGLKRKAYPEISKYGEKILASDLDKLAHEAVIETTEEIVSFVSSAWRESDSSLAVGVRFDPVLNIGGGTYYFYDALKKRIPHLQKPDAPVFANAWGYARASAALLEKKLKKDAEVAAAQADTQA